MANLNKTCAICKKKYSYCPTCASDARKPSWMAVFCCENCRTLYNVINDFRYEKISKEEAFNILSKLDLSVAEELPRNFKESFDEILSVKVEEKIEESIVETVDISSDEVEEVTVEEKIIEQEVIVKDEIVVDETIKEDPVKPRKRNYNKKTNVVENINEE